MLHSHAKQEVPLSSQIHGHYSRYFVIKVVQPGDLLISIDLKDAYFHLPYTRNIEHISSSPSRTIKAS
ncbi:UNVERIFIED_CONTAM: hypothetical protein FKN15_022932 [Acipenser sinensis]